MNINALVIEDERAARGGIDVVLLDLSLPDSEGGSTLSALQSAAPQAPPLVVARTIRGVR